jgi:hypothetical protein
MPAPTNLLFVASVGSSYSPSTKTLTLSCVEATSHQAFEIRIGSLALESIAAAFHLFQAQNGPFEAGELPPPSSATKN